MYLPQESHIGVSQRIENEEEREALRAKLQQVLPAEHKGGYIIRTMAEGATDDELRADIAYLDKLWDNLQQQAQRLRRRPRCCTKNWTSACACCAIS